MKVILLQNIKGFGQIGDVKNVSDGYGRNFLLPRKMAKAATEGSLKEVEFLKARRITTIEVEKKNALEASEKLRDLVIELSKKASKTGKLFAGIDKEDLIKEIQKTTGIELKKEMIDQPEPIKNVGEHLIDINLSDEVRIQVKIVINAE